MTKGKKSAKSGKPSAEPSRVEDEVVAAVEELGIGAAATHRADLLRILESDGLGSTARSRSVPTGKLTLRTHWKELTLRSC